MDPENAERALPIPQLARIRILSLKAEHNPMQGSDQLKAELNERFQVELEGRTSTRPTEQEAKTPPNCRINVRVFFSGRWLRQGEEKPVVQYDATYEGRFVFAKDVDVKEVDHLLRNKFYRDSLVAQVYPLAYTHMADQLRLMGLTSGRKIGFNPNYDISRTSEHRPKATKRKKAVANSTLPS
ncbi:hypothetical protein E4K72_02965 [Oxalobacteraceae bacterium OM1]|nr:hypothetical protein E4K72_02965 [Oxalobacteraceae bacterium OM1]